MLFIFIFNLFQCFEKPNWPVLTLGFNDESRAGVKDGHMAVAVFPEIWFSNAISLDGRVKVIPTRIATTAFSQ
jgi:hypothetical protein